MEIVVARCAGLDVHQKTVMACVRVPGRDGQRVEKVRRFATFTGQLLLLRDWLRAEGVTQVAMEATGVYWRPVWHVLESQPGGGLLLVNPHHVKKVPGRKTDVSDAAWLAARPRKRDLYGGARHMRWPAVAGLPGRLGPGWRWECRGAMWRAGRCVGQARVGASRAAVPRRPNSLRKL